MKELRKKTFKNGVVYCLQLEDGFLVETTDTFLPYYTKDAIGRHQNKLDNNELGGPHGALDDRSIYNEWVSSKMQVLCYR